MKCGVLIKEQRTLRGLTMQFALFDIPSDKPDTLPRTPPQQERKEIGYKSCDIAGTYGCSWILSGKENEISEMA